MGCYNSQKKGGEIMRKSMLGKAISTALSKIGTKVAEDSTKKACPLFAYQPKCPKALKNAK